MSIATFIQLRSLLCIRPKESISDFCSSCSTLFHLRHSQPNLLSVPCACLVLPVPSLRHSTCCKHCVDVTTTSFWGWTGPLPPQGGNRLSNVSMISMAWSVSWSCETMAGPLTVCAGRHQMLLLCNVVICRLGQAWANSTLSCHRHTFVCAQAIRHATLQNTQTITAL